MYSCFYTAEMLYYDEGPLRVIFGCKILHEYFTGTNFSTVAYLVALMQKPAVADNCNISLIETDTENSLGLWSREIPVPISLVRYCSYISQSCIPATVFILKLVH